MALLPVPPTLRRREPISNHTRARTRLRQEVSEAKAEPEKQCGEDNITRKLFWRNVKSMKPQIVHPALRKSRTASRSSRYSYGSGTTQANQPRFDDCVSLESDELCKKQDSQPLTGVLQPSLNNLTIEGIQVNDYGHTMQVLFHCVEGVKETSLNATEKSVCIIFPTPLTTVVPGRDLTKLRIANGDNSWQVLLGFSDEDKVVLVPWNTSALIMVGDLPMALSS